MVSAWQQGAISKTTLYENLQRGEIIDPERTYDQEQEQIEQDGIPSEKEVEAIQRTFDFEEENDNQSESDDTGMADNRK